MWPNWQKGGFLGRRGLAEDLIYPMWFEGLWRVESIDLNHDDSEPLQYMVKFQKNRKNQIIGDRSFNAQSIGKANFGEQFLDVEDDPKSPNRQLALLKGNRFLETTILNRVQDKLSYGEYFRGDELALQIFHDPRLSRISKVETLSFFEPCKKLTLLSSRSLKGSICGEQWQVIYKFSDQFPSIFSSKANHYYLELTPLS